MSDRVYLLNGAYGIYVPQAFAENCDPSEWGISGEDAAVLRAGPDHEWYWETWDRVLCNARRTDKDGCDWILDQDGDLFTLPVDGEE